MKCDARHEQAERPQPGRRRAGAEHVREDPRAGARPPGCRGGARRAQGQV